jgi:predicted MFS family arabinose efflux permease
VSIQYYQTTLYAGVGITGSTVLLIAGVYGTCAFIANISALFIIDKVGRRRMLGWGSLALSLTLLFVAVMTRYFGTNGSKVGQGFIIAGQSYSSHIFGIVTHNILLLFLYNRHIRVQCAFLRECE